MFAAASISVGVGMVLWRGHCSHGGCQIDPSARIVIADHRGREPPDWQIQTPGECADPSDAVPLVRAACAPARVAHARPPQINLAEHRIRRKQVLGGLTHEYQIAA